MTNREKANSLSNKDLALFLIYGATPVAERYNDPLIGLTEWFDEELDKSFWDSFEEK